MTELFRSVKPESTEFPYEAQEDQIAENFTLVENEPQNHPIKNRQILLSLSFFFILFTQLRNSLCPQVGRFPSLIQSVKFRFIEQLIKSAHAPCLSHWERCREATERVNCTIVTRTNSVFADALPCMFVGNDPVSFRGSIVARTY